MLNIRVTTIGNPTHLDSNPLLFCYRIRKASEKMCDDKPKYTTKLHIPETENGYYGSVIILHEDMPEAP